MNESEKLDLILSEVQGMKSDIQGIKGEMQGMKSDIQGMKAEMQGMKSDIQGIKGEMQGMKSDIQGMKAEMQGMKSDIQGMKAEMQGMKGDIQDLKDGMQMVNQKITGIQLIIENDIRVSIQRVAEGHLDLSRNLHEAMKPSKEVEMLSIKVRKLESDMKMVKAQIGCA